MVKFFQIIFILLLLIAPSAAQSGRRADPETIKLSTDSLNEFTVAVLYSRAASYAREKFTEFETKKIPYTQSRHLQVLAEQKQMAAKYANHVKARQDLAGADFYYLGRLDWMATNSTDAAEAFEKFLQSGAGSAAYRQTARSVIVVISAADNDFAKAEQTLAEYKANEPLKLTEIAKMEKELAHSYRLAGQYALAVPHAENAFKAAQELLGTSKSRAAELNQLLDSGITTFEIHRELGDKEKAEAALVKLREKSIPVQSNGVYYKAIDELIKYKIDTNRKSEALMLYMETLARIPNDFNTESQRRFVLDKFKKRESQYRILGERAPNFTAIERWLPYAPQPLPAHRGKVILLDFWATWCGPCLKAFPSLIEWHNKLKDEGLVIIGMTRFYGEANGKQVDKESEIAFLDRFKTSYKLPYSLAVADGQANQLTYGATAIPTAVLIDRRGIVRYVESGASESREQEILKKITQLLAEN